MKKFSPSVLVCIAAVLVACSWRAMGQSTAFSYQGVLDRSGVGAEGLFDLRFRLFDAAASGTQLGGTLCLDNVAVSAGLFKVELDFGQQFASASQRYLQVEVRGDTGQGCLDATGYVVLTPRQVVTAVPLADHAKSAFALDAADGSPTNAVYVDNGGSVGVGTTTPLAGLHVKKEAVPPGGTLALEGTTHTYLTFFPDGVGAGRKGYFGFASATTNDITIGDEATGGRIVLATSGGSHYAVGGDENLRIVRGTVSAAGGIIAGSGFTVHRATDGYYEITFTTPFAGTPTVTATPQTLWLIAAVSQPQASGVNLIVVANSNGPSTDSIVNFIAVGPR